MPCSCCGRGNCVCGLDSPPFAGVLSQAKPETPCPKPWHVDPAGSQAVERRLWSASARQDLGSRASSSSGFKVKNEPGCNESVARAFVVSLSALLWPHGAVQARHQAGPPLPLARPLPKGHLMINQLEIGATKARNAADKQAFFESGRRSAGAAAQPSRTGLPNRCKQNET